MIESLTKITRKTSQEESHELFFKSDLNSDGKLDRTNIHDVIERVLKDTISVTDLELLFGEFDSDRNGEFNECEFRGMMRFILKQPDEDTTTVKIKKAVSDHHK